MYFTFYKWQFHTVSWDFWKVKQRYYAANYGKLHRHMVHTCKVMIYVMPKLV
jgi:hypothetical protein